MPTKMGVRSYSMASEEFSPDVTVGNYCSIAKNVIFLGAAEHNTNWTTTFPLRIILGLPGAYNDGHPKTKGPIVLGHDVWVGMGAIILSGVTIGNGAVIGAGAVISKNVPPYMIVAGNPAKEIRLRFSPEICQKLEQIQWWHWSEDRIRKNVHLLCGDPVKLVAAYNSGET